MTPDEIIKAARDLKAREASAQKALSDEPLSPDEIISRAKALREQEAPPSLLERGLTAAAGEVYNRTVGGIPLVGGMLQSNPQQPDARVTPRPQSLPFAPPQEAPPPPGFFEGMSQLTPGNLVSGFAQGYEQMSGMMEQGHAALAALGPGGGEFEYLPVTPQQQPPVDRSQMGWFPNAVYDVASNLAPSVAAPVMERGLPGAAVGMAGGAVMGAAGFGAPTAMLGAAPGAAGGAVIGGAAGLNAGTMVGAYEMAVGDTLQTMKEAGVDAGDAQMIALAYSLPYAGLQMLQLGVAGKYGLKVLKQSIAGLGIKEITPEIAKNLVARAVKEGGKLAAGIGGEIATEGAQRGISEGAAATGLAASGEKAKALDVAEGIPAAMRQEMKDVAPSMIVTGGVGGSVSLAKGAYRAATPMDPLKVSREEWVAAGNDPLEHEKAYTEAMESGDKARIKKVSAATLKSYMTPEQPAPEAETAPEPQTEPPADEGAGEPPAPPAAPTTRIQTPEEFEAAGGDMETLTRAGLDAAHPEGWTADDDTIEFLHAIETTRESWIEQGGDPEAHRRQVLRGIELGVPVPDEVAAPYYTDDVEQDVAEDPMAGVLPAKSDVEEVEARRVSDAQTYNVPPSDTSQPPVEQELPGMAEPETEASNAPDPVENVAVPDPAVEQGAEAVVEGPPAGMPGDLGAVPAEGEAAPVAEELTEEERESLFYKDAQAKEVKNQAWFKTDVGMERLRLAEALVREDEERQFLGRLSKKALRENREWVERKLEGIRTAPLEGIAAARAEFLALGKYEDPRMPPLPDAEAPAPVGEPIVSNPPESETQVESLPTGETQPAPPAVPQSMVDEFQAVMDLGAHPPVYIPVKGLELSKEVKNFKKDADPETGEVEPLEGEFDDRGVAPIAVWRRTDGRLEVISGRHRLAHAKRNNRNSILSQVFNEADGFGADQAAALDAELNIRDGHGKVTDYGSYFRRAGLSKATARKRGLLRDTEARKGFTIGTMGSDDVFTSWENGAIETGPALAIVETAGADNAGQAIGLNLAISRPQLALDIPRFRETLKALLHMRVQGDSTMDMFGTETYDTAIEEAERRAAIAGRRQREIADKLAIFRASKVDKTKASDLGIDIDVKDKDAVQAEEKRLRLEAERWRDWPQHPDLVQQVVAEEQGVGEVNPQVDMTPAEVEVSDVEAAAETVETDPAERQRQAELDRSDLKDGVSKGDYLVTSELGFIGKVVRVGKKNVRVLSSYMGEETEVMLPLPSNSEYSRTNPKIGGVIKTGTKTWKAIEESRSRPETASSPDAPAPTAPSSGLGDAKEHLKKGFDEAIAGLDELFSKPDDQSTGGPARADAGGVGNLFDPAKYEAALPHLRKAWQEFLAAGKSVGAYYANIIGRYGKAIKPYLDKFVSEALGLSVARSEAKHVVARETQGGYLVSSKGLTRASFDRFRELCRDNGGRYDSREKAWFFQSAEAVDRVSEAIESFIARLEDQTTEDFASVYEKKAGPALEKTTQRSNEEYRAQVSDETKALLGKGREFGMTKEAVDGQAEDAGRILSAFSDGRKAFILANQAGSGKTFVLGAAIREMRARGVKRFVYYTMNQNLIGQIKRDLAAYGVDDITFATYSELQKASEPLDGAVVIYDESHNIKNVKEAASAQKAKAAMPDARFVIFSSATPFESPTQAEYMAASGLFDAFGDESHEGFFCWACAHGATAKIVSRPGYRGGWVEEVVLEWSHKKTGDAKRANQSLRDMGVFQQRRVKLPKGLVSIRLKRVPTTDQALADIYNRAAAVFDGLLEANPDSFIISSYRENLLKRITEAAKVDAAIAEAKRLLAEGKNVVIFTETKSERQMGKFQSKTEKNSPYYSYPQMLEQMEQWRFEKDRGADSPPPFSSHVMAIAAAMHYAGLDETNLPAVVETLETALSEYGVSIFTGDVSAAKADQNKAAFMSGRNRVLIATMAKGGTGLSLHDQVGNRPTVQVALNLPWTASAVDQVSARTARQGLKSEAEIVWLFSNDLGWESEKLVPRVAGRMKSMGASVSGDVAGVAHLIGGHSDTDFDVSEMKVDEETESALKAVYEGTDVKLSAEAQAGPAAAVEERDAIRARILVAVKGVARGLGLRVNIQVGDVKDQRTGESRRDIDAAYKDGTVVLNYDGIIENSRRYGVSPEAYAVGKVIHEGIIHHGFSFLSEKSRQHLTAWVEANVGADEINRVIPDIDAYRNLSPEARVEEYIARIAERARTDGALTEMQGGVWRRVVAAFRKAFRVKLNTDLAAIARTPAEVNKLVASLILDGGNMGSGPAKSTLRWSVESEFKKVRFVSVGRMARMMGDRPAYLDHVIDRMSYAHARLMNGEMTTPDVIRAYVITTASIQAGAMDRDLLEKKSGFGFRVDDEFCEVSPSGVVTVRPEDAVAAWLMTEEGERAVSNAARGRVDMKDWENVLFIRRAFGNASVMERMFASNLGGTRVTMSNINELTTRLNDARTDPDKFHEALRDLHGVSFGKAPFIAHLLGLGTEPTVDAVEINAWLTGSGSVAGASERVRAHADFLKRSDVLRGYTHKAITKRVKQLGEMLGQDIDPEVRATIIHHWLWDAARGTETRHTALYLAMDGMRFSAEADVGNEPHLNAMPRLKDDADLTPEAHDKWLVELEEWLAGAPATMAFVDPDDGKSLILVSREARQAGKWRQTFWHKVGDGWVPHGHVTFDTRLDAVRDVSVYGVDYDPHILFSAEAYHGSPHRGIEKTGFSTDKIGTGEGNQAYGWGLYFAGREEVAEYYRETLSGRDGVLLDGVPFRKNNSRNHAEDLVLADITVHGGIDNAREYYRRMIGLDESVYGNNATKYGQRMETLERIKDRVSFAGSGQLYEVELAPDDDEYLLWDKPLSEQSEKVRGALVASGLVTQSIRPPLEEQLSSVSRKDALAAERRGEPVFEKLPTDIGFNYQQLSQYGIAHLAKEDALFTFKDKASQQTRYTINGREVDGSGLYKSMKDPEAASTYLHSLGIRGIKYLDGTSRSKGEGAYNYVIFNDKDVKVKSVKYSAEAPEESTSDADYLDAASPDIRYSAEIPESTPVMDALQIYGTEIDAAAALIRQVDVQLKSKQVPRRETMATIYTLVTRIPKEAPGRDKSLKEFWRVKNAVQVLEAQYRAEANAEQTILYEVDPSAQQGFLFSIEDTSNGRPDNGMASMEMVALAEALIGENNIRVAKSMRNLGLFRPDTKEITVRSDLFAGDTLTMLLYRKVPTAEQQAELQEQWGFLTGVPASEIVIHYVKRKNGYVVRVIRRNHQAALHTLAHEIGHAEDYAPGPDDDGPTMKRGRILGRIAKLRGYLGTFMGVITADERKALRRQAQRDARQAGFDPKVDKEAFNQAVRQYYGEALAARLQETGDYNENQVGDIPGIRDELEALTQWWRGITPEQMDGYFRKGEELYADMISVLLNQPDEFRVRCPQTYRAMGEFFSRHPEMRDTYVEIQTVINEAVEGNAEELMDRRLERLRRMMVRDEDVRRKVIEDRNSEMPRLTWRRFWNDLVRIIQARDVVLPDAESRMAHHDIAYAATHLEQYHRDIQAQVVKVLDDAGVNLENYGLFLALRRVAYDEGRQDIANFQGTTDDSAQALLDRMRVTMGDRAFTAMTSAAESMADIRERHIFPRLEASGLVDAEFLAKLRANRYYSTFEVAKYFAEFSGGNGTKILYKQFGSVNDIMNPFYSTMATDAQIVWAALNNRSKMKTVEGLRREAPGDIYEPKWTFRGGIRTASNDKNPKLYGLLEWREGTQQKAAIVPLAVAKLYEHNPTTASPIMSAFMTATSILKRVMTTNNPRFGVSNFLRDFRRTYRNMPTNGFWDELLVGPSLAVNVLRSFPDAFRDAFLKQSSPLVREMYERGLLIPGRTWSARNETGIEAYGRIQKEWNLALTKHENLLVKAIKWVFEDFNQMLERVNKIAGYRQIRDSGMSDMDLKRAIRADISSPDFLQGGAITPATNIISLFSNAAIQELNSLAHVARTRPITLGIRITISVIVPKMIMAYFAHGEDEDDDDEATKELRRRYKMIPERDNMHRTNFPVMGTESGYISLPEEQSMDFIGSIVWAAMASEDPNRWGAVRKSFVGLVPGMDSLNSFLDVARVMVGAAQGINEYDYFRGAPVVDQTTWEAGGLPVAAEVGKWAYNEIIGSKIGVEFERPYSVRQSRPSSVPVLGAFLRSFYRDSDFGIQEQEMFREKAKEQADARKRMPVKQFIADTVRDMEERDDMSPSEIWGAAKKAGAVPEGYKYSQFRSLLTSTLNRRFGEK